MTTADPARSSTALAELLGQALHPLETPIGLLPIGGYCPPGVQRPRAAAVLIAVTDEDRPQVVLTRRSNRLRHHAGQVAFPGGGREPGDRSVVDTALRETEEETGIPRDAVAPLGYLGRYDTITGYRMTAVAGTLRPGIRWTPDRREIEEVFAVPLEHVIDPNRYRRSRVRHEGRRFELLTLDHDQHHIWGATAALLYDFGRALR